MFNKDMNAKDVEHLSSIYDGESLPKGELVQVRSESAAKHMKNWSLIGSAMRSELSDKIDTNFTNDLFAKLELEENVGLNKIKSELSSQEFDQDSVVQDNKSYRLISFAKKVGVGLSQLAIAASITVVTVIGWQIYNASSYVSNYSEMEAVKPTLGPVGGLNLTSYQTDTNASVVSANKSVDDFAKDATLSNDTKARNEVKNNKEKEFDRINSYMKEYILDTAAY